MIASIPSPAEGVWYLGPVPLRAYALAILLGIVVAIWLGERRWVARGGRPGEVMDIAIWAVPFGIVGARLYHVVTDWDRYFGPGQDALRALQIWSGGLSIFGAIAGGVLGGYIAARRKGIPFPALADALAPGIILAQAIGRWGNYFNQELFGGPTDLPWGLEIDPGNRPAGYGQFETFHPTFLYESLWAVTVALLLIWADKRFQMGHGRVFALYVALYTAGRAAIETLRIDTGGVVDGPAREILGLRVNAWVSIGLFVAAIAYIVISARVRPGREVINRRADVVDADAEASEAEEVDSSESDTADGSVSVTASAREVGQGTADTSSPSNAAAASSNSADSEVAAESAEPTDSDGPRTDAGDR